MGLIDELKRLSAAEDFFRRLEVEFDPRVLAPARLHILRRMGESLSQARLEELTDAEVWALAREALRSAYADFTRSSPLEERVFKVHRQAKRMLLFGGRKR
jgi:nitrogenase-stabilizing/protective protein